MKEKILTEVIMEQQVEIVNLKLMVKQLEKLLEEGEEETNENKNEVSH